MEFAVLMLIYAAWAVTSPRARESIGLTVFGGLAFAAGASVIWQVATGTF